MANSAHASCSFIQHNPPPNVDFVALYITALFLLFLPRPIQPLDHLTTKGNYASKQAAAEGLWSHISTYS